MRQLHKTKLSRYLVLALLGLMMTNVISCSTSTSGPFIIKEGDHIKVDVPLEKDSVNKIRPWATTKEEILDLFGPPTAIARKGKVVMTFPPPGHLKAGFVEVNSETFFEPFSLKFKNTEEHIVYYYYHPTGWEEESKLWLYINQINGIVEDYIFRGPPIKKDAQFGWEEEEEDY